jgi:aryl-alcohol dehydrogenase-like predicted oxidoreductase
MRSTNGLFAVTLSGRKRSNPARRSDFGSNWVLAKKPIIVPIPGTGKVRHLEENIESAKLVLTTEDMKEIANASSEFKVHGGRMNEQQMKIVEQ